MSLPFVCYNCKQPCRRLIVGPGIPRPDRKQGCENCYDRTAERPTYLHQRFVDNNGIEGCKNLTVAKSNIIANRVICKDDPNVVVDRRTGKETQY